MYLRKCAVRLVLISNVLLACNAATSCQSAHAAGPQVQFLAKGSLSGTSRDLSGLGGELETGTPAQQLGGFSAIEYSGEHDRYIVLSDRGPGDGAASFACRFHELELRIDPAQHLIDASLVKTTMLNSVSGSTLSGALTALQLAPPMDGLLALDAEGLRLTPHGDLVISDEYGPSVALFESNGKRKRQFELPPGFKLCEAPDSADARGTFPNRGIEGLAQIPARGVLIAAMQGPLIQDGAVIEGKCLGLHTRWIRIDTNGAETKQFVYPLTDETSGVSEVLAIDEHQFLVLERDSQAGLEARIKHIYLADLQNASDVTDYERLDRKQLADSIKPIKKTLLIDLLDDRWGLGGLNAPEKPEGITWGPKLPDGRRLLIVCTDNDFENDRTSDFYAFAVRL